jgi:hypothetical protein
VFRFAMIDAENAECFGVVAFARSDFEPGDVIPQGRPAAGASWTCSGRNGRTGCRCSSWSSQTGLGIRWSRGWGGPLTSPSSGPSSLTEGGSPGAPQHPGLPRRCELTACEPNRVHRPIGGRSRVRKSGRLSHIPATCCGLSPPQGWLCGKPSVESRPRLKSRPPRNRKGRGCES